MALVRDIHPPDDGDARLNLRGKLQQFVRRSTVLPDRHAPRVHDVTRASSSSSSVRSLWTWVAGRIERRRTAGFARPRSRPTLPSSAPVILDVEHAPPSHVPVRVSAPFVMSLLAMLLLLLGSVLAARIARIQTTTRDRTVWALQESRLGLAALAGADTVSAATHFAAASATLEEIEALLGKISVESGFSALSPAEQSTALVRAGLAATSGGQSLTSALAGIRNGDTRQLLIGLRDGLARIRETERLLTEADALLPPSVRPRVAEIRTKVRDISTVLAPLDAALPTLLQAAGESHPKRYLLVFQNTSERRGTGGFMGSMAIVEFDALRLTRFDFRDVYSIDWAQQPLDAPPAGLARYYRTIHLRDANYLPDFPEAAAWIESNFERSGGGTLDGVIAVDSDVFFDIVEALGPLTLPGSTTVLTSENTFDLLTVRIETSKRAVGGPKSVLKDFLPTLSERAKSPERWAELAAILERAVLRGHIQAFAKDAAAEDLLTRLGIDGRLPSPDPTRDELLLVSTNVGGNKSDRFVTLDADHRTTVASDGSMRTQLTLTKTFTLPEDFDARIRPLLAGLDAKTQMYVRSVLGDGANKDYLRVFLPLGTKVRSIEGLKREDWETHDELGRSVVGLHLTTNVGEIRTVKLLLDAPQKLNLDTAATYRFSAIRTPGSDGTALTHTLTVDPGLRIVGTDGSAVTTTLTGDRSASFAAVITRQ